MKILVTGTRGIPNIQGGVETHCEELYPNMTDINHGNIILIRRSAYADQNNVEQYKGINIKTIYSPKSKSFEAIIHSFLSVMYAAIKRPDVVHIHAVGPNLVAPIARLMGLKVVMTHHGPDYERKKWGPLAKTFLKLGEWSGVKFSNKVIVISEGIGQSIAEKFGRNDYELIPNGVPIAVKEKGINHLQEWGLEPKQYIFSLGRFVPEKAFDYLIKAWKASKYSDSYKLVIAGDADHESEYSRGLKESAKAEGVVLTGFIKGTPLYQLFTHARLFVIPSFYEGLPIALLEAMSYGLNIIASDISANKEVNLPDEDYFESGNIESLKLRLVQKLSAPYKQKKYNMSRYDWENIAKKTYEVYQEVVKK